MVKVVSATEARVRFGELIRRVREDGETYIVERAGARQVVVLSVDRYDALVEAASGDARRDSLARGYALGQRLRAGREGAPIEAPEEAIRLSRQERDSELDGLR
jgi:prevent-host-death family protein